MGIFQNKLIFCLLILLLAASSAKAQTQFGGQVHLPFDPDATVVIPSPVEPPIPSDPPELISALQSGVRIRVELKSNGRVFEFDLPHQLLMEKIPAGIPERLQQEKIRIEEALQQTYAGIWTRTYFFLIFKSKELVGKPEGLIAIEAQLRLPISVDRSHLPSEIQEIQLLYSPTGELITPKTADCKEALRKFI